MPSSTPLKRLGAILARAKSLITGGEGTAAPIRTGEALSAPESEADAGSVWEPAKQDKSFWVTMAGADRRLAELRRAIDQAAAEADTRELGVEAQWSNVGDSSLGERRCEKANRMITDALGRGEILIPPSAG